MKALVMFATLALVSSSAFASQYNPGKIYNALRVEAVLLNPGQLGATTYEKSVGGLSCTRHIVVVPHAKPSYACDIDNSKEDMGAIYEALDAKVVNLNPGIAGSSRLQKSVGGLVCIKSQIIVPGAKPSYDCEIKN